MTPDDAEQAVSAAVGWLERNQDRSGRWLYRYDRASDEDLGGYNLVRHAGLLVTLYQAAATVPNALSVADEGRDFALARLVRRQGWAAVGSSDRAEAGATALLVAALVERRDHTGSTEHDDVLADLGRFLVAQVEPTGAVSAAWTPDGPTVGTYSVFFTGETAWALARLRRVFPDGPWADHADRVLDYLGSDRDDAEDRFPPTSDHWAAYAIAERVFGQDPPGLDAAHVAYARRLAEIFSVQVRYESQRTGKGPNLLLRGHRALGAGVGTLGEGLAGVWAAAEADDRLRGDVAAVASRAACVASLLVDRQVNATEAASHADSDRAAGAWFTGDVTQMDDQQHPVSALALLAPRL